MYRIALIVSLVIISAHTAVALSGSGTEADHWRIETPEDFNEFAADANYWAGYTRLETDVNLAGRTYSTAVIAPDNINSNYDFDGTAFTGVFDGNDHKVINLTIDGGAHNDILGLFGFIGEEGEVRNLCIEVGSVSGTYKVGGLVGENGGNVSHCYSTGNISGDYDVGGLLGNNGGSVSDCYSNGSVSGDECVGGLVGNNYWGGVLNCYSIADVNGVRYVGGLLGWNRGESVSNCYSTGSVSGNKSVGGLVGKNGLCDPFGLYEPGYIYNSFSTGRVQGDFNVGGLVGKHEYGAIEKSFWDVQTSEQLESDGGMGKTTAEMQTKSTFTDAGWDFMEIWDIGEKQTYPYLRQYLLGDLNHDGRVNMLDFAILAGHWLNGAGG